MTRARDLGDFIADGGVSQLDVTGNATITVADNSTALNIVSTDADADTGPRVDLTRNSASPAANDILGQIRFMGEDAADNSLSYVSMFGQLLDPTDGGEDGSFELDVRLAGSNRSRMISNATETVFNDDSVDLDFRVESDNNANMLFVEGGTDRVAIGHSSPNAKLDIMGQGSSATNLSMLIGADEGNTVNPSRSDATDKALRIGMPHRTNAEEPAAVIVASSTSSDNTVMIGGGTSVMNAATNIRFITGANTTTTSGTERFRFGPAGQLGIGGATYGTSGQVLTSGGSGAAPSWVDAGGGAYEVISDAAYSSGASSVTFSVSPDYNYQIEVTGLAVTAGGSEVQLQCSHDSFSNIKVWEWWVLRWGKFSANGAHVYNEQSYNYARISYGNIVGDTTDNAAMMLINFQQKTGKYPIHMSECYEPDTSAFYPQFIRSVGRARSTDTINQIRLLPNSGQLKASRIRLLRRA